MWDLIVSVPDHCLSFYLVKYYFTTKSRFYNLKNVTVSEKHIGFPNVFHFKVT